jgi:hypothetical protein
MSIRTVIIHTYTQELDLSLSFNLRLKIIFRVLLSYQIRVRVPVLIPDS